jgi:murein DD-endopeptidase MepM/ murein hydrolase activator NlpD
MSLRMSLRARAATLALSLATMVFADGGVSQSLAVPRNPCAAAEHARLSYPAFGEMITGFGFRTNPFTGIVEWHAGIDYLVRPGEPLKAAGLGRISKVGGKGPANLFIAVDHGRGLEIRYVHLDRTDRVVGRCVR